MTAWMAAVGSFARDSSASLRRMGAEERAAVLRDQARGMFVTSWLYVVLGTSTALAFSAGFESGHRALRTLSMVGVVACYVILLLAALRWRRTGDDRRFIRSSCRLKLLLGVSWSVFIGLSVVNASADQYLFVIGLVMALAATAMLSAPLVSAFAFFLPIAGVGIFVVTTLLPPVGGMTVACYFGYLIFVSSAIVYFNNMIISLSIGRLDIQRKHETIAVFLKEYEDGSDDWLWMTDAEDCFLDIDAHGLPIAPARDVRKRASGLRALAADPHPDGDRCDAERLRAALDDRGAFRNVVVPGRFPDGIRWLSLTGHPIFEAGDFRGYRGIASDITEARQSRRRVEFLAAHDGLTALLSRRAFVDGIDALCARGDGDGFVVVLLDLDDFKRINDTFGHQVGDDVIREIAERILSVGADAAYSARFGGDEFALCFAGIDLAAAEARMGELIGALARPIVVGTLSLELSASAGLARFPGHAATSKDLLRFADMALYAGKGGGKGVVRVFERRMENEHSSRIRRQHELLRALETGQIEVEYQPIYDVVTGALVSMEALARWNHPTEGKLAAGSFIPAAEASGLIDRLGAFVLRATCLEARGWHESVSISVNVSARQLQGGTFVGLVRTVLAETSLPPARLALEVTESVLVGSGSTVFAQLEAIRAMGVRLVLDDFGTGFSSLAYLHRFTVDGLKIDHTFTRDLVYSAKVGAIVKSVADLAAVLGIYVVAEGVETGEQLDWLRANGIRFGQGFLLGEPSAVPALQSPSLHAARSYQPRAG